MIKHEYLELFNQSSIKKEIDILYDTDNHITNNDVVSGSFNLNESAYATKELKFGSLVSSQMTVKLFNTVPNLMYKKLDISITVDNIVSNPLKIGKYKVLEDKPTTDRLYKQIKAYDGLYEVINKNVVDWYEGLSFPLTQKAFRDSFFDYVGITQVDITLINDDMLIEKTITANTISGQQVLSAICEINGAIGRMNRDGNFEYVILEVNPTSRITIDKIVSKNGSYEDFDSQPISKVQIRQTTDDIGAIVGENGNTYIVQDNFLVYGKSSADLTAIATNLLSVIEGITYTPFNIKAIYGNPCYEIGDAITVVTRNKTFNSYIFNRTLKGIQAMSDTIKADGVEYYTENLNSVNVQVQQLKRQTNELTRTVEETKSTITSIETVAEEANQNAQTALDNVGTAYDKATEALDTVGGFDERITKNESSITQNAKEIALKVSKGDVSSQLSVESGQVTISGNRLVVDADNFTLDANGSATCSDMNITGGSMDVTGDNYQSKIVVHTEDNKSQTLISPRQLTVSQENGNFVQLNSDMANDYYGVRMSRGSYATNINHTSMIIGKSGSTSKYFSTDSSATYSKARIITEGELQSTASNGLRLVQGNYGFFIRNDGSNIYFMLTASGDQYGRFNSLRPLYINTSTGAVTMGHGLTVSGGITCDNNMSIKGTLGVTGDLTSAYQISTNGIWAKAGIAVGSHSSTPRIKHIHTGSVALTPGSTSSTGVKLLAHSTIQGWYSGATVTKTAIIVTNGDGKANGTHLEGATYTSEDGYWYVVANSAIGGIFRVNYVVICW